MPAPVTSVTPALRNISPKKLRSEQRNLFDVFIGDVGAQRRAFGVEQGGGGFDLDLRAHPRWLEGEIEGSLLVDGENDILLLQTTPRICAW